MDYGEENNEDLKSKANQTKEDLKDEFQENVGV